MVMMMELSYLPVRYTEHHVCAADSQNSCCGVKSNPGNFGSGPLVRTHSRYALYDSLMPPLSAIFSPCVLIPFSWKTVNSSCFIVWLDAVNAFRFALVTRRASKWIIQLWNLYGSCDWAVHENDIETEAIKRLLLLGARLHIYRYMFAVYEWECHATIKCDTHANRNETSTSRRHIHVPMNNSRSTSTFVIFHIYERSQFCIISIIFD